MSEARIERIICRAIRDAGGDPEAMASVLDLAALGLANRAWRDTCVEDWHAEGRLSDGDMLRVNSRTSHGILQRLRGWRNECAFSPTDHVDELDDIEPDEFEPLVDRLFAWLTNPGRELPTGTTLGALAGPAYATYRHKVDLALGGFAVDTEEHGPAFSLRRMAAHGATACVNWWGHPTWPGRVEGFVAALDDPADEHWGVNGELRGGLAPEPDMVRDRSALRGLLLRGPWNLDGESAEWIVSAGVGDVPAYVPYPGM